MNPVLSLCVVARNSGSALRQLLKSAADRVDEMVVVDLGSTDGSVAAARCAGARVIEVPAQVDAARARGIALGAARGRWCLLLEPGEGVAPATWSSLWQFILAERAPLGAVWVPGRARGSRRRAVRLCRADLRFALVPAGVQGLPAAHVGDTGLVLVAASPQPAVPAAA